MFIWLTFPAAMYHELEEDAAQRSGNLEALYSMPIKKQDRVSINTYTYMYVYLI